ncbi:lysoplasmalogenase family protein [Pseudobutyrivibrio ruminis]|uniref:lysoplasmalogenase family protein n=1 Tax=Pseudobutyrivibrio ruminis TaxID=46206 RepID=UPI00040DE3D1
MIILETIIYVALIIALFAVCDNRYSRRCYVPLKVVCSASFLVIFFLNFYYSERLGLLMWALLACFVGDILMGMYNTYLKKQFMVIGIIAFMLGHVGFLNYMCRITEHTSVRVYIVPVFACLILIGMRKWCHLHIGSLFVPCIIYCYFVSTMTLKAIECGLNGLNILGVAGVLFLISDFTILFLYFYHFSHIKNKRAVHYVNLATYYAAIILFIYSL